MGASLFKIILISVFAAICSIMAIRIKGKIVLLWLVVLLRYYARPRIHVLNKNTAMYREDYPPVPDIQLEAALPAEETTKHAFLPLGDGEKAYLLETLNEPMNHLRIELTKKGGFNVRISEAKE
jgi:hypothetical protein